MSVPRFILALIAGALLCYWAIFLVVAGGMAGKIYFDGDVRGTFVPGYLTTLYLPPLAAIAIGYFALRKKKR